MFIYKLGFHFLKHLGSHPSIKLNIPDTLYVKKSKIYRISTNEKGFIVKTIPEYSNPEARSQFLYQFIRNCVSTSHSPISRLVLYFY